MPDSRLHQPFTRPMRLALRHILLMLLLLPAMVSATPHPSVAISQAKWAKGMLSVKGSVRHSTAASVDLYDGSGRLLGQAPVDSRHRFNLMRNDLDRPELLCSVQAKASDAAATVAVKGKPKSCAKAPQCKILSPVGSVAAAVSTAQALCHSDSLRQCLSHSAFVIANYPSSEIWRYCASRATPAEECRLPDAYEILMQTDADGGIGLCAPSNRFSEQRKAVI
ncbi:MAG: hypothetical protein FIA97_04025 [Methylococcaceae bacterium]|nr:hypothetical protein [Methylococcaceae bacterium]